MPFTFKNLSFMEKTMKVGPLSLIVVNPEQPDDFSDFELERLNRQSRVDWTTKLDEFEAYLLATESKIGVQLYRQYLDDEIDEQTLYRELYFIMYTECFD
jgi:hypothetical protein